MCVICFFSNLCAVSFHDGVLILLGAVSTPVDDGPYFFNIVNWLVNLPTIVSLSDWEESFHFISFVSVWLFHFVNGSFQVVYTESMYSGLTISCDGESRGNAGVLFVPNMHSCLAK